MPLNIDEIYDLFTWDISYSDEEYESRVEQGVAEAGKLRNIYPFIQPIIAGNHSSKSIWEPCARVVAMKSDVELEKYLYVLFKWLKDMNWPGAEIIFERLSRIPLAQLEEKLEFCRHCAKKENDIFWLRTLNEFKNQYNLKDNEMELK